MGLELAQPQPLTCLPLTRLGSTLTTPVAANEPVGADGLALTESAIDLLTPLWTAVDPSKVRSRRATFLEPFWSLL